MSSPVNPYIYTLDVTNASAFLCYERINIFVLRTHQQLGFTNASAFLCYERVNIFVLRTKTSKGITRDSAED